LIGLDKVVTNGMVIAAEGDYSLEDFRYGFQEDNDPKRCGFSISLFAGFWNNDSICGFKRRGVVASDKEW
jgi:hypothetical protein